MPSYGIHNYANREIGLTTPQVQMATFTPLEFKPQFIDPEHFKSVIDKMDAADAEAQKEKTAIDMAYADQRKKIHKDPKTLAEFDKIVEGYNQKVKDAVNASNGSYHRLGSMMKTLAADSQNNKAIAAMTQQQEGYDEWKKELLARKSKGEINDTRYRRLISEVEKNWSNISENLFERDENGEITSTKDWQSPMSVTNNLNAATLSAIITQLTAYQAYSRTKSGSGPVMLRDDLTVIPQKDRNLQTGNLGASSSSHTYTFQKLTKKQLDDTFNKYIAANPNVLNQFAEEMDDLIFELHEWEDKLNNPDLDEQTRASINSQIASRSAQLFGKGAGGGGVVDPLTYFKKSMKELIGQSAYERTTISDDNDLTLHNAGSGKKVDATDDSKYINQQTNGTMVETEYDYNSPGESPAYTLYFSRFADENKQREQQSQTRGTKLKK